MPLFANERRKNYFNCDEKLDETINWKNFNRRHYSLTSVKIFPWNT